MKTNIEWQFWGARDPLGSVASWRGKEAGSPHAWRPEEFLALGASDFADVREHWQHYGMTYGLCVEIGCGAGRMTKQLATTFPAVLALDVSPGHVAKAKEILGASATNVAFTLVKEPVIPLLDSSADAMFSCHVFQHLPGLASIDSYIRETSRVLRGGATTCFHVPVPGAHLTSAHSAFWSWARNRYKRLQRSVGILAIAEYHSYPAQSIFSILRAAGFVELQLRVFPMKSNNDYHSFFFARKP